MRSLILVITILASSINADVLVIDPGHGGPGADMYNNGGGSNNYNGSVGPVHGLAEQWVNWQVAQSLITKYPSSVFWVLTRDSMTQDVSLIQRVAIADSLGNHFLSIHHNGLPLHFSQQTEVP